MQMNVSEELLFKRQTKSRILLHALFLDHTAIKTTHFSYGTLHQTNACSNSNSSAVGPTAFTFSHTSVLISGTVSSMTSGFLQNKLKIFVFSNYFSYGTTSFTHIILYNVCVCVCESVHNVLFT